MDPPRFSNLPEPNQDHVEHFAEMEQILRSALTEAWTRI
jgi:hypothetical protein